MEVERQRSKTRRGRNSYENVSTCHTIWAVTVLHWEKFPYPWGTGFHLMALLKIRNCPNVIKKREERKILKTSISFTCQCSQEDLSQTFQLGRTCPSLLINFSLFLQSSSWTVAACPGFAEKGGIVLAFNTLESVSVANFSPLLTV